MASNNLPLNSHGHVDNHDPVYNNNNNNFNQNQNQNYNQNHNHNQGHNHNHNHNHNDGTSATESSYQQTGKLHPPSPLAASQHRKFANPAPLGLCAFALTTFVLSLINLQVRGVAEPNIVIALAFGYGGLVQLLAGMWEMAVGNTFGATALSSFGGFWLSFAIILTPGGFAIASSLEAEGGVAAFHDSLSFYLFGWFIFTFLLLLCTLKTSIAFFSLFFTLDLAFLFLALAYLFDSAEGELQAGLRIAGGVFGILAAFLAWYNALVGMIADSDSFFSLPVGHFPWSVKGQQKKRGGLRKDHEA